MATGNSRKEKGKTFSRESTRKAQTRKIDKIAIIAKSAKTEKIGNLVLLFSPVDAAGAERATVQSVEAFGHTRAEQLVMMDAE